MMSFDHASSIETMSLFETLKERFIMEIMLVFLSLFGRNGNSFFFNLSGEMIRSGRPLYNYCGTENEQH